MVRWIATGFVGVALAVSAGCSAQHRQAGARRVVDAGAVRGDLTLKAPEAIIAWIGSDPSILAMSDEAFEQLLARQRMVLSATDLSPAQVEQLFARLREMRRDRIAGAATPGHADRPGG